MRKVLLVMALTASLFANEIIYKNSTQTVEVTMNKLQNIVTKKGGTREDMKPEVVMDADYSSYDTQSYTVRLTGNAKSLGYVLAGGYRSSDGYLRNSDYEIYDITGRVSYLFPFEGRLTLGYKGSFQDSKDSPA